jgi:hypothetical protein
MDWMGWLLVALWTVSAILLIVIVGGLITGRLFTRVSPPPKVGEAQDDRVQ